MSHGKVVGIDLGTTYSVVAYLDSMGRPQTIPNALGDVLTPSALLFDDDDVIVGKEARKASVTEPDRYADCFKRDVGNSKFHRKLRSLDVPPEVLNAFLLRQLKQDAEARIGAVTQAVITAPAFFDESRRKATQDAGRLAGLEVLDIINEPTAAALAFGQQQFEPGQQEETLLVYDLGGGTFDVTVLKVSGSEFRTIATDGDVRLGGKDFDERLVDHLADRFLSRHGIDPRSDPRDAAQLWLAAQDAKHSLSQRSKTAVMCTCSAIAMTLEVAREEFEELIRDLLDRTETTTTMVIRDAGLEWSDISRILLIGGSTRIPAVADMLFRVSGKEPDRSASPDEAVAHGAAIYAGMLQGNPTARRGTLINVNSHSLGVVGVDTQTRQRVNSIVIPKNSALPCRVTRTFVTNRQGQRDVKVPVIEGESLVPDNCIFLGECVVRDLPEGLPKGTAVHVEFAYGANGRISVSARVPAVRQSALVELDRSHLHKLEELTTWESRLRGLAVASDTDGDEGPLVNLHDRTSVLRRLDFLFTKIGEAVVGTQVPRSVVQSQQAASEAMQQLTKATQTLQATEAAKRNAVGGSEAMRFGSDHARAKQAHTEAQAAANFAHLVLGRDCVKAKCVPESLTDRAQEAKELQATISGE